MKKAITNRWIAAYFALTFLFVSNSAMAQIKIVGNDYSQNLSGSKSYYDRDVDFEKYFPVFSSAERFPVLSPDFDRFMNLTGDTIYNCKDRGKSDHNVGGPWDGFTIKDGVGEDLREFPKGYYVVSGYVFCTENADSIREKAGLDKLGDMKIYWPDRREYCQKRCIRTLKEEILELGDAFDTYKLLFYQWYVVLNPLDENDTRTYYLRAELMDYLQIIQLKYYNQLVGFIGNEIRLIEYDFKAYKNLDKIVKDGISGDIIKLEDDEYEVVDVVLKYKFFEGYKVYIVLKGERTGSFALETIGIYYTYSTDDLRDVFGGTKSYDKRARSSLGIPTIKALYNTHTTCITTIIKDKDWQTLEQRAKKTKEQQEKEWKQQQKQIEQEKANKESAYKNQMITKYGSQYGGLVANRQVAIGMTKEMCQDAWGKPINTYKTITQITTEEVWCYNYKTRIYFVNDIVVRIEN